MKHVFIVNPHSGTGEYKKVVEWVEKQKNTNHDYEIRVTSVKEEAIHIAQEYSEPNTILYAVGGDGTINEVVNGLQSGVQLAVIPVGTGNDFYRMIDYKGNVEAILDETVNRGRVVAIDCGVVNGRKYINSANFGLDSAINNEVNGSKDRWFFKKFLYLYIAVKHLFKMRPVTFEAEFDGDKITRTAILTSVMNGRWYGGGFMSAPNAVLNDGYLDVCIVQPISILKAFNLLPKYMMGKHLKLDVVELYALDFLNVTSKEDILYGLDGEVFTDNSLEFRLLKRHIMLRVPEGAGLN